jgi:hypothetical protein
MPELEWPYRPSLTGEPVHDAQELAASEALVHEELEGFIVPRKPRPLPARLRAWIVRSCQRS